MEKWYIWYKVALLFYNTWYTVLCSLLTLSSAHKLLLSNSVVENCCLVNRGHNLKFCLNVLLKLANFFLLDNAFELVALFLNYVFDCIFLPTHAYLSSYLFLAMRMYF